MRVHEFIERLTPSDYRGGKKSLSGTVVPARAKLKTLSNGLLYGYYVNDLDDTVIFIKDPNKPEELIGRLILEQIEQFPMPKAHRVVSITVDPDYEGKGLAQIMYNVAMRGLKYTLLAGKSQTPGGRQAWVRLNTIPGVQVMGWIKINDKYFDTPYNNPEDDEETNNTIDSIMQLGGQYIGKDPYRHYHYFAFNVKPGSGELAPEVDNLIQLYGDKQHYGGQTGLFAVYTGQT
jgi:hypothetical protein